VRERSLRVRAPIEAHDQIDFYLFEDDSLARTRHVGDGLVMRPISEGAYITGPTFSMRAEESQRLMDELWSIGLRPLEAAGTAGSLAATTKHLEDMRALAFSKLEVPKP
jgi:hypothetical protein